MVRSGTESAGDTIGIALLGLGVVGSAVVRAVAEESHGVNAAATQLEIVGALVRDRAQRRDAPIDPTAIHTDPSAIIDDPRVAVVVEVMGGEQPAFDYVETALRAGKHVVTANKEMLSKRGVELARLAAEHDVYLAYEASVGGGIPIIGPLSNDLLANRIISLRAIINGTTNYILTRMAVDGADFEEALREAQRLGYAEADPTSDVDGFDALYKIAILSRLAFSTETPLASIFREGIRGIQTKDFRYARDLGYTIKLLAVAGREADGLLVRVHPALVPLDVPMASANGVLNAVEVEGSLVGTLWFQGRGAGPEATASAILGDVIRIARSTRAGNGPPPHSEATAALPILTMDEHISQYYLRIEAIDRSGVLARIAGVLGDLDISIHSVIQMDCDRERGTADLVIMTHSAREVNMQAAVARIRGLDVVASFANLLRVESYDATG